MTKMDLWNRAVDEMRQDDDLRWHAVADWLRAEVITQSEMEPFTELLNAQFEQASGVKSFLRFGRDADGEPKLSTDTNQAATAVALAYLESQR